MSCDIFDFVNHCSNCGGPIAPSERPVKCPFCDTVNAPAPKEVQVAVPVQIVNVVQGASPELHERRCPHCKKRLVTVVADGVSLSGCGACGGIWVDNASARKVLANPESVFADLARRAAAGATGSRGKSDKPTCAECPAILDRSRVAGIDLDTCTEHGTWFDARELETLVKMLRRELEPPKAVDTIYCQACQQPIAANRANITDRGLVCDACWRGEQRELQAIADAKMNENSMAVGGVFLGVAAVLLGAAKSMQK